jgi:hypothetical protein
VSNLSDKEWQALKAKLETDGRLEKFVLGEPEQEYVTSRGMEILRLHAADFVNKRLAPAKPKNDGRQTPTKGHPVFIAQHACGCNEMGRELSENEVDKIVDAILRWIEEHLDS